MQAVNKQLIDTLFTEAAASPRKRAFHTFHEPTDMFNRVLIAGTAGSYAQPHRHAEKFEAFSYIEGGVTVLEFNDTGEVINAYDLRQCPYVELAPTVWHSVIYTTERWAIMEFALWKQQYDPADKEFAPWAPQEGNPEADAYLATLTAAATSLTRNAAE